MIEITVNGATELVADLRQFPDKIQSAVILKLSQVAYDEAQRGAGKHVVTGALFQSLYNRSVSGGRQVGHDPKRAPHAGFVQYGTRPHKITPKNKQALRWPGQGGFIFAKSVNHPGYKGDAYMIRARDAALLRFNSILDESLRDAI